MYTIISENNPLPTLNDLNWLSKKPIHNPNTTNKNSDHLTGILYGRCHCSILKAWCITLQSRAWIIVAAVTYTNRSQSISAYSMSSKFIEFCHFSCVETKFMLFSEILFVCRQSHLKPHTTIYAWLFEEHESMAATHSLYLQYAYSDA